MIQVLYVDDEAGCLTLAKTFLEEGGDLAVDISTGAGKALEMLAMKRYDVLVSDYSMPGTDGLELLRMVREMDGRIPFILFSGRSREEVVIEAFNSGATFYVQKGDDLEAQFADLAQKVRQAATMRATEEDLRTKRLQARMAIDLARIASWEYDVHTQLYTFDDIFYELLGTTAAKEGGHTMGAETYLREFVHPDDVDMVQEHMMMGTEGWPGEYHQMGHRMVRRDGEVRYIMVRVGLLKDANGRVIKVVGVNQDVTDR